MVDISTLPDSVNDLKALIHKLNDEALLKIKSRDQKIQLLEDKISILQRDNYAPKSEKVPSNQLGLFNEAEELLT